MSLEIRKLSPDDGKEFYDMLQEMPADENGFVNSVAGKSDDEYQAWLGCYPGSPASWYIVEECLLMLTICRMFLD